MQSLNPPNPHISAKTKSSSLLTLFESHSANSLLFLVAVLRLIFLIKTITTRAIPIMRLGRDRGKFGESPALLRKYALARFLTFYSGY
jgi:hypothetical protein